MEMTAQLPSLVARPVPLVVPTGWGLAFRRGALVPGDDNPCSGSHLRAVATGTAPPLADRIDGGRRHTHPGGLDVSCAPLGY